MDVIPESWQWQVATKYVAHGLVKFAVGLLAYQKAQALETALGIHIDPTAFQDGLTILVVGAIHALHDWAALKFPNVKFL